MADFPVVTVEAALVSNPLDASPTYTTLPGFRSARTRRGRSHELDRMQAGIGSLVFRNETDDFNPWNTASAYYGNLLTANQSSVETNTTGLVSRNANCTIARTTAGGADGSAALRVTAVALGEMQAGTLTQTNGIAVVGGREYTGVVYFKPEAGHAPSCAVVIDWWDSGGSIIDSDQGGYLTSSDAEWRYASMTATAPANAAYAAVSGYVLLAAATSYVDMDKFSLHGGDSVVWGVGGRGGNLQPMVKVRVKAEWNLLSANQASVETDTTGLTSRHANATISRTTSQAADGAASMQVTATALDELQAGTLTQTDGIPVSAGRQYTGVVWFKAEAGHAPSCAVVLDWWDASGSIIDSDQGGYLTSSDSEWRFAYMTATAPAGAAYAAVSGYVLLAAAASSVYMDKLGLFPGNSTVWSAGGPYYLFTGYVESIEHSWPAPTYSETTITLVDGFKVLSLAKAAKTTHHDATLALTPDGYWRFNEPGTASTVNGLITAVDDSGNAAHGTYKGSPAAFQQPGALPAEIGGCVDLGVRQGLVELPIGACPSGTGDWGVGLWVYLRSFEQVGAVDKIWHVTDVGSQHVEINIQLDGKPRFWVTDGTNGGYLNADTEVPLFRWFRLDAVKIGTTGPANWKLYIDKVDVSDTTSLDGTGNVSVTANSMLVGGRTSGGLSIAALDGLVDEAAIFPSDTSGDVGDLYDAGYGLATTSLTGVRIDSLLDVAGFPAADRSLDTGQYVMQPVKGQLYNNSPLPLILDYVDSEGYPAAFFFDGRGYAIFEDNAHATPSSSATFGDGANVGLYNGAGGDPPVRDDGDLYTTVVCQADDGAAQMATDATAAARYVDRTLSRTGLKNADDADVATLATDTLARVSTTGERIKGLTVHPVGDPGTLWPLALGLDIQDRIGYERATFPGGGSGMTLDLRIEGVEHDIRVDDWFVTFMAVPL